MSTQAKSVAMTALDWERMNCARVGAGGALDIPNGGRCDGVSEPVKFAMDAGFSRANQMVSRRICGSIGGRPRGLFGG